VRNRYHLVVVVLVLAANATAQKCGSFRPAEFGQQKLIADFQDNVFRVVSGVEVGTAYLIDPEHGYLLTAAHVVKASIDDKNIPISLSQRDYGVAVFKANHVANMNDVALLQLEPPDALSDLPVLDISFEVPGRAEVVTVFGYGSQGDDKSLTAQPAPVLAPDGDQEFSATMSAFYGDSGGPAINKYGQVVGTGVDYLSGSLVARFVPSAAIRSLLDRIQPTARTLRMDGKLRADGYTPAALAVVLTPNASRLTNLEWYTWAVFVSKQPTKAYERLKGYFPCPIADAFRDRSLDYALERLAPFQDERTFVGTMVRSGDREFAWGAWDRSLKAYDEAGSMAEETGIKDFQFQSSLGAGRAASRSGLVDLAEAKFARAYDIGRSLGNVDFQAQSAAGLADVWTKRGDRMKANLYYKQAFDLARDPAIVFREFTPATSSPTEKVITSGQKLSGSGKQFSEWYTLCTPENPSGYVIEHADFHLVGDRRCGAWAECEPVDQSGTKACFRFRMQGHDESAAGPQRISEGVIEIKYRAER